MPPALHSRSRWRYGQFVIGASVKHIIMPPQFIITGMPTAVMLRVDGSGIIADDCPF